MADGRVGAVGGDLRKVASADRYEGTVGREGAQQRFERGQECNAS